MIGDVLQNIGHYNALTGCSLLRVQASWWIRMEYLNTEMVKEHSIRVGFKCQMCCVCTLLQEELEADRG